MKLNGGQVIAKGLRAYGVQYVAGVPGYGNRALLDGLESSGVGIPFIRVVNEQSAVHMADGYFRACGSVMAVVLPARTGLFRAAAALSTCLFDSSGVLLITGDQLDDKADGAAHGVPRSDNGASAESGVGSLKQHWKVRTCPELPLAIHRAFNSVFGGRPGPVHLEVPLEIQKGLEQAGMDSPGNRLAQGRLRGDPSVIEHAARLLASAERPIILAGGGVIAADAAAELTALAEAIPAPILIAGNGIGAVPNDHDLNGGLVGSIGSSCGTTLLNQADLVIAVGSRLSDLPGIAALRSGASGSADQKMIHIDVERDEIGKRYPVEVGIVADAKSALIDLRAAMPAKPRRALATRRAAFVDQMRELRSEWRASLPAGAGSSDNLIRAQRPFVDLRKVLQRDAIVVIGTGAVQQVAKENFAVHMARTFLSPGLSSAGGWAVPAAIGAKLGMPGRQVVCVVEDSDFLQSMQEMAVSVMHSIPVVYVIYNQCGPEFVPGAGNATLGKHDVGGFSLPDGRPYHVAFADIARSFGLEAWRVEHASQLEGAFKRALDSTGPALVEVMIVRHESTPILAPAEGSKQLHAV